MLANMCIMEALDERVCSIHKKLTQYASSNKKIFVTSSFQTQSLPLLHIISTLDVGIPVYFIDTGYLFPETYLFKDALIKRFGLNVITLKSNFSKIMQVDKQNNFLFMTDPDRCCHINKVLPLEPILQSHDVWVSGVRESQSQVRKNFTEESEGKHGIVRYHPLLKWSSKEIYYYSQHYQLPEHPLQAKGYVSVGCVPCTAHVVDGLAMSRQGRWAGMKKEECGLHTELMNVDK